MTLSVDDAAMHAVFSAARTVQPTNAEVLDVVARAEALGLLAGRRRRRAWTRGALAPRWQMTVAALTLAVALAAAGYAAAPPLRAAVDDVAATFGEWLAGQDEHAPGRPLRASDGAPAYFHDPRYVGDPRVIAEADGYKLFAAREVHRGKEWVQFDLGDTGVGMDARASDLRDHNIIVLGPAATDHADEHGHVPLFGITSRGVRSLELTYASGPALRVDRVAGGFVLLAEPTRAPHEIIAFDDQGRELDRVAVDASSHWGARIDWHQYGPPAPRIPAECQPDMAGLHPPASCPNAR
jgi:hypothetical protein